MTHHVISIDILGSFSHDSISISLLSRILSHHGLHVWSNSNILIIGLPLFPVNLKFSYSWLLHQNVAIQLRDIWHIWRILNEVWKLFRICIIDVVSHSEELLSPVV